MMFSNIIGLMVIIAVVVAHPTPKKTGYSIVTHHVEPKKVHHSEWTKPSDSHDSHGKVASSYSSLTTGSKHSEHKPLVWSPPPHHSEHKKHEEHYEKHHEKKTYPKYKFDYGVSDPHTGDNKKQWEKRDGDEVKGAYQVIDEKNGAKSLVEYSSNKHTGLLADVTSKFVKPHHSKW